MKKYFEQFKQSGKIALKIKVRPGMKKTEISEELSDGTIKLDLKAIPEKGKANVILIKYLTKQFGVGEENVKIISGKTSRNKIVKISNK